jgi:polyprenyl P-hydroxybenzoate/phenylacrylic acid decarboxylase-like protein
MPAPPPSRLVVGVTGATGAAVAERLLTLLDGSGVERHLVVSPAGRRSALYEIGRDLEGLAEVVHPWKDIGAPIASGSFRVDAMVIVPCSVRTMSSIAYGTTDNLIARAADVVLKERRRLVLGFRETPLHLGHLRAMTAVTEAGAIVAPLMPAFYLRPDTVDDMVEQLAHRLLDLAGFPQPDAPQWSGDVGSPR